jgi:hypothetical protein
MADLVIILGAGASCDSGAPMMGDFLDRARHLLDTGLVNDWRNEFELVFRAQGQLSAVHSKARLDFINLESVFNSFEMAAQLRKFPGLSQEEIDRLGPSITTVIVRTIELCMKFPMGGGVPQPPSSYGSLADFVKSIQVDRKPPLSVALLTFNYDIGLDVALRAKRMPFTYALDDSQAQVLPLLKLHGSLNWVREGDSLRALDVGKLLQPRRYFSDEAPNATGLAIDEHPEAIKGSLPFIVPPTMSKGEYHRQILPVWRRAAKELGNARHIAVCGYSLPNTDEFFKVLYGLGSQGPEALRSFLMLDPDPRAHERMRALLGPGAESRFDPHIGSFASLSGLLGKRLRGR